MDLQFPDSVPPFRENEQPPFPASHRRDLVLGGPPGRLVTLQPHRLGHGRIGHEPGTSRRGPRNQRLGVLGPRQVSLQLDVRRSWGQLRELRREQRRRVWQVRISFNIPFSFRIRCPWCVFKNTSKLLFKEACIDSKAEKVKWIANQATSFIKDLSCSVFVVLMSSKIPQCLNSRRHVLVVKQRRSHELLAKQDLIEVLVLSNLWFLNREVIPYFQRSLRHQCSLLFSVLKIFSNIFVFVKCFWISCCTFLLTFQSLSV